MLAVQAFKEGFEIIACTVLPPPHICMQPKAIKKLNNKFMYLPADSLERFLTSISSPYYPYRTS